MELNKLIDFQQASKNRQAALKAGEMFYHGRDCKNNHGGLRYAKHRKCYECRIIDSRERYLVRKEKTLTEKVNG